MNSVDYSRKIPVSYTHLENDAEKPVGSQVVIVSEGGKVNIRVGNGTQYGRITQLAPGTTLRCV